MLRLAHLPLIAHLSVVLTQQLLHVRARRACRCRQRPTPHIRPAFSQRENPAIARVRMPIGAAQFQVRVNPVIRYVCAVEADIRPRGHAKDAVSMPRTPQLLADGTADPIGHEQPAGRDGVWLALAVGKLHLAHAMTPRAASVQRSENHLPRCDSIKDLRTGISGGIEQESVELNSRHRGSDSGKSAGGIIWPRCGDGAAEAVQLESAVAVAAQELVVKP